MSAETPDPLLVRDLDESLYNLDAEETAFYKAQTRISDDDALRHHIVAVQRDAYAVHPYPCIHRFAFTQLKISRLPAYAQVLALGRTRAHAILLDIGCCFGNDLRKAVADGFPRGGCIASDLRPEFWAFGHRLFRSDAALFPVPFVAGDALDAAFLEPRAPLPADAPSASPPDLAALSTLRPLHGRVSAIHASSFFHLFDEAQQAYLARALAPLLSPEPGSMLLGSHGGLPAKGHRRGGSSGRNMFCHSPESWVELWTDVFGEGKVKVDARLVQRKRPDSYNTQDGSWHLLQWSVTLL